MAIIMHVSLTGVGDYEGGVEDDRQVGRGGRERRRCVRHCLAGFYWIALRLGAMGRNGFQGYYAGRRNGFHDHCTMVFRTIAPVFKYF